MKIESHKRRQRNTETHGKTHRCNDVIFFQIDVFETSSIYI